MPAYLASGWDLTTCTLFRAIIARRTRRMSSSLLPLNMTPAMTSIHPPAWWNGPLGPLTTGRDLYGEDLRGSICLVLRRDGERPAGLLAARRDHASRDQAVRLSGSQSAPSLPCRALHAPRRAVRGSLRRSLWR